MYYNAELRFLRDTLHKCRIQTVIADLAAPIGQRMELHPLLTQLIDSNKILYDVLPPLAPAVIYRLTDPLSCRYLLVPLPELPRESVLIIGPYLPSPLTQKQILEQAEKNRIPPSHLKNLETYYVSIPTLPDTSHLFVMLDTFAQRLWGINICALEDVGQEALSSQAILPNTAVSDEKDIIWNMRNMELRYSYENELMDAVALGQEHKADLFLNSFSHFSFEQRLTDPVRNGKNYCIIMNTLLRKAAERGGVHPVYLDSLSSSYAGRIEQLDTMDAITPLMSEMFRGYCKLVRKHSTKDYSPPVQKVITCIDADLTGVLTLKTLSEALNISGSYLSTLFKKETGLTLTEYINNRRISHAKYLLTSTQLQVQTVAQHCGIVDVHYFSRVFKKVTGQTPKEYREANSR